MLGAPIAAAIATVIVDHLVAYDPAQYLANGQPNHLHVALSLYHELLAVSLGLAFLMMVTGLLRKRMILGMVMGLYGLGIFTLHLLGIRHPVRDGRRLAPGSPVPTAAVVCARQRAPVLQDRVSDAPRQALVDQGRTSATHRLVHAGVHGGRTRSNSVEGFRSRGDGK